MKVLEGNVVATGVKIGIVAARFNEFIVSKLVGGAEDALVRHGVNTDDIELAWVQAHLRSQSSLRKWQNPENMMQLSVLAQLSKVLPAITILYAQR